jgi:hypothetical protein
VRAQAADVVELLTDPARCQVALVTLPEEMPVNEVVEAAYQLEDRVGVALGPVIVNGCYDRLAGLGTPSDQAARDAGVTVDAALGDALDRAAEFRRVRQDLQTEQVERLRTELPLPQLRTPFLFTSSIGPGELDTLADALAASIGALQDADHDPVTA